jgi:putative two-component system response regulator
MIDRSEKGTDVGGKFAVIIEDNLDIARVYATTLEMIGYDTEIVTEGQRALQVLETSLPQLIVLDMNLPQISGHYLYKSIRANPRLSDTAVFIATANTVIANALADGIGPQDHIVIKPVSPAELRDFADSI